ncbi:hypothetical protein H1P_4950005 [Hyella patelloides LEGE 07179]|uniref:Uncharacterized protein n=1 Tax=Hyella patelloides LEGE 07179 TaxID=945734 RepID=A0A563VZB9_9CYAN|nr:hypothetical protein H1P_4950005 [Hyella patelloides LEGE 07179]
MLLIASRSPSHLSLPFNSLICFWRSSLTNVFSPSSTTSFLVFNPVASSASFINFSSITILVLIFGKSMCIESNFYTHYIFFGAGLDLVRSQIRNSLDVKYAHLFKFNNLLSLLCSSK